jgi:hypothetical protein
MSLLTRVKCPNRDVAKRGVVQDISYSEGEFVYVRPAYPDPEDGVERDFWVAKILQIRVASTKDVYALVCSSVQSWGTLFDCLGGLALLARTASS